MLIGPEVFPLFEEVPGRGDAPGKEGREPPPPPPPERARTSSAEMWIKLALLAVALAASSADEAADPQMLRNAMEHLLQIRAPESAGSRVKRQEDPSSPHHYMMELYKKYLASDSMKTRSNTIRSLTPQRGQVDGEEMLLFNLTALSPSEVITSVELHFYKRRSMARKKYAAKPHHQHYLQGFAVDSDDSGAKPVRLVGKWEVGLDKRGWQVYDVTTAVDAASGPAIGFRFQGVRRSNGQYESLAVEQVVRMEPSPFLVVFSNERSNATLEDAGLVSQRDSNALPDEDPSRRRKRGIDDNELPEADHYASGNAIPQTSPGVLQARARPSSPGSRKISGPSAGSKSTLPYPKSSPAPSSSGAGSTLAWPDDKKRSRSGGSGSSGSANNNNRKGKRRNRKLPETWHYNQQQHINDARLDVPEDAGRALCQRRKLTVDFNEIGWGEWIISPKTFEAQYCAGRCPFPLTKELNPTNHATIQSIVHAIGGHPEVPAPCCVPDVLSSLTLLYFDDNRNVVLKNYPSMTAESCACR